MADAGSDSPSTARRALNSIRPPEYRSIDTAPRDPVSAIVDERGSSVLASVAEVIGWVIIGVTAVVSVTALVNLVDEVGLGGSDRSLVVLWATLLGVAVGLIVVVLGRVLRYAKASAMLAARAELERSA